MKNVPFSIIEYKESYTFQDEGLKVRETKDIVIISICKSFPTPGYFMGVSRIENEDGVFSIYLDIRPPRSSFILFQVITYREITIEIVKEELGKPPYDFKLIDTKGRQRNNRVML